MQPSVSSGFCDARWCGHRFTCLAPIVVVFFITALSWPSAAHAQKDTFVERLRGLAATAVESQLVAADWTAAADELRAALAEWDRALARMEAHAAAGPGGASAEATVHQHATLGAAYAERGRFDDALRHLNVAIVRAPDRADVHLLRALTLERAGHLDAAAAAYRRAWELDEGNPATAYYALRRAPLTDEDRHRAFAVLKDAYRALSAGSGRAAPSPFPSVNPLPDTLVPGVVAGDSATARAFESLAAGRFDDGVAALAEPAAAASGGSRDVSARVVRGRFHETSGRFAEARLEYAGAIPGTLVGRSILYLGIGRLAQADGDFESAIQSFAQGIRLAPNDGQLHKELSGAYAAQARTDEAFSELVAALLIDPRDADAHAAIGQLFVDAQLHAEAIPALTRALELMPGRFERRYALATALARVGQAAEAARQFELFEQARRETLERRRGEIAPAAETPATSRTGEKP